jgi:hypothetical protein
MTPRQFSHALAIVESTDNPNTPKGDGGRADGRWQIHPDEMWTWAHRLALAPQLGETWDSFVERIVEGFYSFHTAQLAPIEVAMTWHIGHVVHFGGAAWDAGYAAKFATAVG